MRTKHLPNMLVLMLSALTPTAWADMQHAPNTFHVVKAELMLGQADSATLQHWQTDAWWGSDVHKLWFKTEGERHDNMTERSEWWLLYSRNISDFWDVQAGLRDDLSSAQQAQHRQSAVLGVHGLAPYFVESDAHLFWHSPDDMAARFNFETTLQLSADLQLRPKLRLDLNSRNDPEDAQGAGLNQTEWGLLARYAARRDIVPFIEVKQQRAWGNTATFAQQRNAPTDVWQYGLGIALLF